MLKSIRDFFMALFIWVGAKIYRFLYKDELKAFESAVNQTTIPVKINKEGLQKESLDIQDEIFRTYISISRKIRAKNGKDMDNISNLWISTTEGLSRALTLAFKQPDDTNIKESLEDLEKNLEIALKEAHGFSDGSNGGFGYNGPMGQA